MKKAKLMATTGMLTALYFVLSALLKIPVAGNIKLDLGYIAMTVKLTDKTDQNSKVRIKTAANVFKFALTAVLI